MEEKTNKPEWWQPQIDKSELHLGCLNCSSATLQPDMDMYIGVGFGSSIATKDGECVWMMDIYGEEFDQTQLKEVEAMAKLDPDHDWQVVRSGLLHGETFQRHGNDLWVCIESNMGFA